MLLQNKRLFIILCVVIFTTFCVALVLFLTRPMGLRYSTTVPESRNLQSVPPQAVTTSEFTSTITDLPRSVTYTETRNLQDILAYLIDPSKKGANYQANYRVGSDTLASDGTAAFLVDVPSAKKTFIVYNEQQIECAPKESQLKADWHCTDNGGRQ